MSAKMGKILLLVDDEEDLRDALAFDFERKGYDVLTAENGKVAFDMLQSEKIDLVISDIRMPEVDGIGLLRLMKDMASRPPVICLTGFADFSKDSIIAEGAERVFEKPFDRKILESTVRDLLGLGESAV